LAIRDNGEAFAVWVGGAGTLSSHYSPNSGWGTVTPINTGSTYGDVKLAVDAHGDAMAVWTQITDHNGANAYTIYASHASGGLWGTPEEIDSDYAAYADFAQIAMQANGDAVVVWTKQLAGVQALWARPYVSGTWGNPQQLGPASTSDVRNQAKIAFDGLGNATLVWATQPDHTLRAQRYEASNGWASATSITSTSAYDFQLGVDLQGNAIVVWNEISGGNPASFYNLFRAPPP
jgi:hypothetical protein